MVVGHIGIRNQPDGHTAVVQEAAFCDVLGFFYSARCGIVRAFFTDTAVALVGSIPEADGGEVVDAEFNFLGLANLRGIRFECFEGIGSGHIDVELIFCHIALAGVHALTHRVGGEGLVVTPNDFFWCAMRGGRPGAFGLARFGGEGYFDLLDIFFAFAVKAG